jgi:hypothetical protein
MAHNRVGLRVCAESLVYRCPAPEGAAKTRTKGTFVPYYQAAKAAFVLFTAAPSGAGTKSQYTL